MKFRIIIQPEEGYETLAVFRESLENGFRITARRCDPSIEGVLDAVAHELYGHLPKHSTRRAPASFSPFENPPLEEIGKTKLAP